MSKFERMQQSVLGEWSFKIYEEVISEGERRQEKLSFKSILKIIRKHQNCHTMPITAFHQKTERCQKMTRMMSDDWRTRWQKGLLLTDLSLDKAVRLWREFHCLESSMEPVRSLQALEWKHTFDLAMCPLVKNSKLSASLNVQLTRRENAFSI